MSVGLEGAPSLGIDTSLTQGDETGYGGIDSPSFGAPPASFDEFQNAMSQGLTLPGGFARQLKDGGAQDDTDYGKASGKREDVVQFAKKFLGMQYHWGGSNPSTSFDCSGFTQYVLGKFGVHLPRISFQQANYGKRTSISNLQAGDLVAWDNSSRNNGADHIALYIGNGRIMEFYSSGHPSRIRKVGKNEGAWGVHLDY